MRQCKAEEGGVPGHAETGVRQFSPKIDAGNSGEQGLPHPMPACLWHVPGRV